LWNHLKWEDASPEDVYMVCPANGCIITEDHKAAMVEAGEWRPTALDIKGHAGFRLNALVSLFENCRWSNLVQDYLTAKKGGPSKMQVFENTVLGIVSQRSIDNIDAVGLRSKCEDFDLDHLPPDVLMLTCGVDTQHDRLEAVLLGFTLSKQVWILGHYVFHGSTVDDQTWAELDKFLRSKWRHQNGWEIGIEATAIDSGGTGSGHENRTQFVYRYCDQRTWRRIFAIKGIAGARPAWKQTFSKKARANKLFMVGVDGLKQVCLESLAAAPFIDASGKPVHEDAGHGRNHLSFGLSNGLSDEFLQQLTNEKRQDHWTGRRNDPRFVPVFEGARTEALDATIYGMAVREACTHVSMKARAERRVDLSKPPWLGSAKAGMAEKFGALERQQVRRRTLSDFGL